MDSLLSNGLLNKDLWLFLCQIANFKTLALLIFLYVAYQVISYTLINRKYSKLVRKYRAQRDKEAAQFLKDFDGTVSVEIQKTILNSTATELLQGLREQKFTSEQALITLALRAIRIGFPMHYAGDINFYGALEIAREKDLERKNATDPSKLPLLHGLPISVKDHVTCKGLKTTAGLSSSLDIEKPDFDCNYVAVLRQQGAIPYMSSNIPQGLGAIETYNNVFGRACNPWNPARTVGGSSGGEAGLIASRCSTLGIGSDAAGSIRIPSAFTGVYGFSPTPKRISLRRTLNLRTQDGHYFKEIGCTSGPMGRNVDDLTLVCKSTFGCYEELDMDAVPIPWNEEKYKACSTKKLRIGYTFDSGFCEPCPAVKNALMETVEKLRARGHTMVEIKHDFTARFLKLGLGIMCPYGIGNSVRILLKGEKPGFYYLLQIVLSFFPRFVQRFFGFVCKLFGERRLSVILDSMSTLSVYEYYEKVLLRDWMKDDWGEMWYGNKLDVLISPVLPYTAIKHNYSEVASALIGTTLIYNLIGSPAGSVPVRRVRKDEQHYESKVHDSLDFVMKKLAEGSEGLPIGIQVASMAYQDEKCLGVMKEIEECFQFHELLDI